MRVWRRPVPFLLAVIPSLFVFVFFPSSIFTRSKANRWAMPPGDYAQKKLKRPSSCLSLPDLRVPR